MRSAADEFSSEETNVTPIRFELPPMDRRHSKARRWLPLSIPVLLIAALAFGYYFVLARDHNAYSVGRKDVEISDVSFGPFKDFASIRGQLMPQGSVAVTPAVDGRVDHVLRESGDEVEAGEPVLSLSNPDLKLDVLTREAQAIEQTNSQRSLQASLRAGILQIRKEIAEAKLQVSLLDSQVSRLEPLVRTGNSPAAQLEELKRKLAYQRNLVGLLTDSVSEDQRTLGEVNASVRRGAQVLGQLAAGREDKLTDLTVVAPADGQLNGLDLQVGEQVSAGQTIATVDDVKNLKAVFLVDEFYLPKVKPGQKMTAQLGEKEYQLTVTEVSSRVQDGQFRIEGKFDAASPEDGRRGQGLSARLYFSTGGHDVLSLPNGPFLDASAGQWVFRVGADGMARKVPVQLGRRTADSVEVLSGLMQGDRVITSSYSSFSKRDTVHID